MRSYSPPGEEKLPSCVILKPHPVSEKDNSGDGKSCGRSQASAWACQVRLGQGRDPRKQLPRAWVLACDPDTTTMGGCFSIKQLLRSYCVLCNLFLSGCGSDGGWSPKQRGLWMWTGDDRGRGLRVEGGDWGKSRGLPRGLRFSHLILTKF